MSEENTVPSTRRITVVRVLALSRRLLLEEQGQDLIEYALVFTFVGLGAIAAMKSLSTSIANLFGSVGTTLTNAT